MTDTDVEVDIFLAHFGIPGMKWGKRKGESTVKSATPKAPLKDSEKSKHRIRIEAGYQKKGLSVADAAVKAEKRIKVEKVLAVAGAVTVVAALAYTAKVEYGKRFVGVELAKGFELKNVNAFGESIDLDRRLYTSFDKGDSKKYRSLLANQLRRNAKLDTSKSSTIYETVLKTKENIKAPSQQEAFKMYKEWAGKKASFKDYKLFNQGIVAIGSGFEDVGDALTGSKPRAEFLSFVKGKGYNALLDANDQFISGYSAKKPLIIFNAASSVVKKGESVVAETLSNKVYANAIVGNATVKALTVQNPAFGLGLAAVGASGVLSSQNRYAPVNKYLAANPNTKKSYAEIYNAVSKDKNGVYQLNLKES